MRLTPRQREIATLVGKGLPNRDIASRVGISERTVEEHVREAAERLGGETRPRHQLTLWFLNLPSAETS